MIRTNNNWRQFSYRYEVPEAVLADQFEHLGKDVNDGFFRYKRWWFHTSDFTALPKGHEWHGAHCCSAFTATLIRVSDDGELYQVGFQTS